MLSRRMILDHYDLVREGLGLRFLGPKESEALDQVRQLCEKFLTLQKEKELLQRERNEIADLFKVKDVDKEVLKQRGVAVKDKLAILDESYSKLEEQLSLYEAMIPNIPDPDVPISISNWEHRGLWDLDQTYESYVEYKRIVLRILQNYSKEYNG